MKATHIGTRIVVAAALALTLAPPSRADDATAAAGSSSAAAGTPGTAVADYFDNWFARVDKAQAEQPHWMTPLVTVTPRLEEELRYDQYWETLSEGKGNLKSFDGGKGLELIPSENTEVILGVPPYQERTGGRSPAQGVGDYPFFLLKYRLLSANEQEGNYILTVFLQGSAPLGIPAFTSNAYAFNPTLAFGKGWGDFDFQATLGESIPLAYGNKLGHPFLYNVTAQYHAFEILWPELEVNGTYWSDGAFKGMNQVFLTPGVIFGRFPIYDRL